MEAYQVDRKLQSIEQDFISKNSVSEEVTLRMRSVSHWRAGLVVSVLISATFLHEFSVGKQYVALPSNGLWKTVTFYFNEKLLLFF